MDELHVHTMTVAHKFSEKFGPFQKPRYLQRGILLPLMCCLVVDEVREGLDGNGCFTLEYALFSSAKKF